MTSAAPDLLLEEAIDILSHLVSFDTESSKSNLPLIEWVETYLTRHGIEYVRVPNAEGDKAALFASVGPKVDGGTRFTVRGGRHPVVEAALQEQASNSFVANDCEISGDGIVSGIRHHGAESIIGGKRGWQRDQNLKDES